ncbi:MAG: nucleotidyltransferase domain-containing protein [Pseudomonadota bacterium]
MKPVSDKMHALIQAKLDEIAAEENIRIILAIESGSRAWGFHSPDSDYDVRFLYARPLDWHFRLDKTRDVIERPIDDELDISGWELGKALGLILGSNAVVAEWLQSPIVYAAEPASVRALTDFTSRALDRKAVTWHYLSLLRRQKSRLIGPDGGVRIKRYFYVLRPALALRWMRLSGAAMPPMDMAQLMVGAHLSAAQTDALRDLTARKMKVRERAETFVAEPVLDALVAEEVSAAEAWLPTAQKAQHEMAQEANQLHQELSLQ